MHPYEMQRLMQWRGKDQVVRVQRGSLYPAVERLANAGLIEPLETARDGPPSGTDRLPTHRGGPGDGRSLAVDDDPHRPQRVPGFPGRAVVHAHAVRRGRPRAAHRAAAQPGQARSPQCSPSPPTCATSTNCQGFSRSRTSTGWRCCEAEHAWVSDVLDDLATGELYWDRRRSATGPRVCSAGWARSPAFRGCPRASPDHPGTEVPGTLRRGSRSAFLTDRELRQRAGGVLRTHHRPGAGQMPCAAPRQR